MFPIPFLLLGGAIPLITALSPSPEPSTPKFPWIRNFASIGDSYSAGLGAGSRLDFSCSRYSQSYPHILHTSLLGPDPLRTHHFLSCSGASTTDILETQVPHLPPVIDLLTISAGGNDIGLSPILSACIYQFYLSSEDDCAQAIATARALIADDSQLYANMSALLAAATPHMHPAHGTVYLTGYASFFAADDAACDNVTWAVWRTVEPSHAKQYLSLALRRDLDALVRDVNAVLARVAARAGPRVRFVEYDAHVAAARGRYCERGVVEPAPNREALVFYEWGTVDAAENGTALLNETGGDVPRGSFEGGIAERINRTLGEHPEWEFDPEMGFVNRTRGNEVGGEGLVGDTIHWMLPDAWKRVFHMRPWGHWLVAGLVVEDLERREVEGEEGEEL